MINDWTLTVATANGTGSQTANNTLVKTLFRMGIPVGAKNLFPSNIQGLPTWFTIRVHPKGFVGRKDKADIFVAFNKNTIIEDSAKITESGFLLVNQEIQLPEELTNKKNLITVPAKEIAKMASNSIRMQKLLSNMVYVGVLAELLDLDKEILLQSVADQFPNHPEVAEANQKVLHLAIDFAQKNINTKSFPFRSQKIKDGNKNKILIDGNSASALGLIEGGCSFLSWYPITPASSLAENFQRYAKILRPNTNGNSYAVVQAEDELSAINMVVGAGWAGSRAITSTSGPGLSLMAEAAGLSYFAEIPTVIWDVQRAGPSTGLPTRTMQGDLSFAAHLSHGDTEHILLLPGSPMECFEFGQTCFDLAEKFQTLVIVLSDLDLGMNLWISDRFHKSSKSLDRGKVLNAENIQSRGGFHRYQDIDGDGVCYRTLPGTHHAQAGYFTRGTGHNENAGYTEDPNVFENLLDRLKKKIHSAKDQLPQPQIKSQAGTEIAVLYYGSTSLVIDEVVHELGQKNIPVDQIRIRALPLSDNLRQTLDKYKKIYVIEQNRDAQILKLILNSYRDQDAKKFISILSYNGLPMSPHSTYEKILQNARIQ